MLIFLGPMGFSRIFGEPTGAAWVGVQHNRVISSATLAGKLEAISESRYTTTPGLLSTMGLTQLGQTAFKIANLSLPLILSSGQARCHIRES